MTETERVERDRKKRRLAADETGERTCKPPAPFPDPSTDHQMPALADAVMGMYYNG